MKKITALLGFLCVLACSTPDPTQGAAARATGGAADGAAGSRSVDFEAAASYTGDVAVDGRKTSIQRNTNNSAAGSTYSGTTLNLGATSQPSGSVTVTITNTQINVTPAAQGQPDANTGADSISAIAAGLVEYERAQQKIAATQPSEK